MYGDIYIRVQSRAYNGARSLHEIRAPFSLSPTWVPEGGEQGHLGCAPFPGDEPPEFQRQTQGPADKGVHERQEEKESTINDGQDEAAPRQLPLL